MTNSKYYVCYGTYNKQSEECKNCEFSKSCLDLTEDLKYMFLRNVHIRYVGKYKGRGKYKRNLY